MRPLHPMHPMQVPFPVNRGVCYYQMKTSELIFQSWQKEAMNSDNWKANSGFF